MCHFSSFVVNISGAKIEEHRSNISRDIPDSVFYKWLIQELIPARWDPSSMGSLQSIGGFTHNV